MQAISQRTRHHAREWAILTLKQFSNYQAQVKIVSRCGQSIIARVILVCDSPRMTNPNVLHGRADSWVRRQRR